MTDALFVNATLVTGERRGPGALAVRDGRIAGLWQADRAEDAAREAERAFPAAVRHDLGGKLLLAGGIDAHVHFREPGGTAKEDLVSGSEAALKGGVTSFVDMPNTNPPTVSLAALRVKRERAGAVRSHWGFHLGATNDNLAEIRAALQGEDAALFGGIKVFMGSSTGNLLVDRDAVLEEIFALRGKPVLIHSEDEGLVRAGLEAARQRYGDAIPFSAHPVIRSREACIRSTEKALDLAVRLGTRLHILHVSTAEEAALIRQAKKSNPGITAETSANYLWFSDKDYERLGGAVKCNPAVKTAADRDALLEAFADGTLDTLGSDHAPHLKEEKIRPYASCPSGIPSVRHALPVILTLARRHGIPLTRVAAAFSENIARILGIEGRGRLETGAFADLAVVDPDESFRADGADYKCGWTPYEGETLYGTVKYVCVDGRPVIEDGRPTADRHPGAPLVFHPFNR